MKTIQYFVDRVKPEDKKDCYNLETLLTECRLDGYYDFDIPEIKCCFAFSWLCTDTCVGGRLYYFNDKFIAYSFQRGRKCEENFWWVNQEDFDNVRKYLQDKINEQEVKKTPGIIEWDFDLGDMLKEIESSKYHPNFKEI